MKKANFFSLLFLIIMALVCITANYATAQDDYGALIHVRDTNDNVLFHCDVTKNRNNTFAVDLDGVTAKDVARLMVKGLSKKTNSTFTIANTEYRVTYIEHKKHYSMYINNKTVYFETFGDLKAFTRTFIIAELSAMPTPTGAGW